MSKIKAEVVADSLSPQQERLVSLVVTFPRIVLSELNTHRMLSKNSASSRAIPTKKLLNMVQDNPFIPIAWQKEHKGMQGTEYWEDAGLNFEGQDTLSIPSTDIVVADKRMAYTKAAWLDKLWSEARDSAVLHATNLLNEGATKQIANRLLEPFMWHTVLITGSADESAWGNFFELRCPQYWLGNPMNGKLHRSRKDAMKDLDDIGFAPVNKPFDTWTEVDWLIMNQGQAEIHMMALAEAIWDAVNESKPRQLEAGEWHIPFENKIDGTLVDATIERKQFGVNEYDRRYVEQHVKISTAMAARTSYTVVGDEKEIGYDKLIGIHDRMMEARPFHASPFEHCARAMHDIEYNEKFVKGQKESRHSDYGPNAGGYYAETKEMKGWCRNFKGFIQYRHIIESSSIS